MKRSDELFKKKERKKKEYNFIKYRASNLEKEKVYHKF